MSVDYARQIAMAERLISKYGQTVTWNSVVDGAPADPNKPYNPGAETETPHSTTIAFFPDTKDNRQFLRYVKGSEIITGSITGLMPAVDFTPTVKDNILRDGVTMNVKTIDELAPNGAPIMYFLEFDK